MIAAAIIVLAALAATAYSVRIVGARMLLMPNRRTAEYYHKRFGYSHPSQIGLSCSDQTLLSGDGLKLSYWIVSDPGCKDDNGAIIYLHGITDSKVSGLNYAKELAKTCRRIYLIDMRRHGQSEGKYCTYGYYEKHDVARLVTKIKSENPRTKVVLLGSSMGAAIAIQTAAIERNVDKVVAVAPFFDLFTVALDHEFRHLGFRNKLLLRFVIRRAEKIARFKASDVSPAKDISKVSVPILIVHGAEDKTIKEEYSKRLAQLNGRARLLTIPNAGHKDVLESGGNSFLAQLVEFLNLP